MPRRAKGCRGHGAVKISTVWIDDTTKLEAQRNAITALTYCMFGMVVRPARSLGPTIMEESGVGSVKRGGDETVNGQAESPALTGPFERGAFEPFLLLGDR